MTRPDNSNPGAAPSEQQATIRKRGSRGGRRRGARNRQRRTIHNVANQRQQAWAKRATGQDHTSSPFRTHVAALSAELDELYADKRTNPNTSEAAGTSGGSAKRSAVRHDTA